MQRRNFFKRCLAGLAAMCGVASAKPKELLPLNVGTYDSTSCLTELKLQNRIAWQEYEGESYIYLCTGPDTWKRLDLRESW